METLIVTSKRTTDAQGNVLKDKNGVPYCVLSFATPGMVFTRKPDGTMGTVARPTTDVGGYSAWQVSNLPSMKGKSDFGWDLNVGDYVQGTIAKRAVQPYFIADGPNAKTQGPVVKDGKTGRNVGTASIITFANTDSPEELELDIQEQFRRKGHILQSANQQQTDLLNQKGIVDATAGVAAINADALEQVNGAK